MTGLIVEMLPIVLLSLLVSGVSVAIAAVLGIPLGAALGMSRFSRKHLLTAVVNTGMALPPVVVGLVVYLLVSRSGPLGGLGWLFTSQAMILTQTILCLPFVLGVTLAAVAAVPPELAWQLRTLGASPGQVRWAILREARAGIVLAVASAFGRSLSEVGAVMLVGGNIAGHTRVLTTAIVLETSKGNFSLALALGAVLLLLALAINLFIIRFQFRQLS